MANKRLVIALGGNALGNTPEEQLELVSNTAAPIVDLIEEGFDVIVTHGNGPQVGMIKVATDNSATKVGGTPSIPFPECGAMSQGYIGYHLQQAMQREFARRGMDKACASIVTQTVVDAADPAFQDPPSPLALSSPRKRLPSSWRKPATSMLRMLAVAGAGLSASPAPVRIVELPLINNLVEAGMCVISTGGGGIPVIEEDGGYKGVPAVIDKDRSAALLAGEANADMLVILTAVDRVCINFNKPDQQELASMTIAEAEKYMEEGQFAKGSMLPKVEACLSFVKANPNGKALITSLERAKEALAGETGTVITA